MNEDDRVAFTDVVNLRTGEVVQIQGSVRVIDEPHREAIKAQVQRAALLDPRWPRQSIAFLKQPAERQVNARYRAMLERVAGQLAAKRRAR